MKVSDEFTVPLCREHHRQLHHAGNEIAWWHSVNIKPLPIAKRLWDENHLIAAENSGRCDLFYRRFLHAGRHWHLGLQTMALR